MLERNELSSHEGKLKCMLLSERSQSEKAMHCMIPMILQSGRGKTMEALKAHWLPRARGQRG